MLIVENWGIQKKYKEKIKIELFIVSLCACLSHS